MRGHRPVLKRWAIEVTEEIFASLPQKSGKLEIEPTEEILSVTSTLPIDYERVLFKLGKQYKEYDFEGVTPTSEGKITIFLGDKTRFSL